MGVPFWQKVIP